MTDADDNPLGSPETAARPLPKPTLGRRLSHAFSDPGKRRIFLIGGLAMVVFGVIASSQLKSAVKSQSNLASPPQIDVTPGGAHQANTPDYRQSVINADTARAKAAEETGRSALATINPDVVTPPPATASAAGQPFGAPVHPAAGAAGLSPADEQRRNKMSEAMRQQLQDALASWKTGPGQQLVFTQEARAAVPAGAVQAAPAAEAASPQAAADQEELIHAGDIFYGTTVTGEISSDPAGPIVADVLSGPLQGARLLGNVQNGRERFVLIFNSMSFEGKRYPINAVAVDVDTMRTGIRSDIDRRYPERLLAIGADFLQAAGQIFLRPTTTTVATSSGIVQETLPPTNRQAIQAGIGGAGQGISTELNRQFDNLNPIFEISTNYPIGVLFMSPIYAQATLRR